MTRADMCSRKQRHDASARFWSEAFRTEPQRAEDLKAGHRYRAACTATMAAQGTGKDQPRLDETNRARRRKQALGWLNADLAAFEKSLDSRAPDTWPFVQKTLEAWRADAALSCIRDEPLLAKLPQDEQKSSREFWSKVDRLLTRARTGAAH
jgi:hypothetical protein